MAFTASGIMVAAMIDKWDPTALATDLTSDTALKAAFYTNAVTPNYNSDTAYGSAPWNANESAGAGYSAGGVVLTGTTFLAVSGSSVFDCDNISIPSSTITAAGYLGYDDPNADRAIWATAFGSEEETQDGTFLVTHDAAGVWAIDLTP